MSASIVALALFLIVGLGLSVAAGRIAGVLLPTVVAFAVRVVVGLIIFQSLGVFSPDGLYYDSLARDIVDGASSVLITPGKEGWPYLLAGIYGTFGPHAELGLIVNATFSALIVPMISQTARLLGLPIRASSWLAALFPTMVLWSSLLLRESMAWFGIALCAMSLAGLVKARSRWPYAIAFVAGLACLSTARGPAALIIAVGGIVALAVLFSWHDRLILLAASTVAATLIVVTPLRDFWEAMLGVNDPEAIVSGSEVLRDASTAFPLVESSGVARILETIWIAGPRVAVGPLPTEWLTIPSLLVIDGILWLVIVALGVAGVVLMKSRRDALVLLLPAIVFLASLILSSGNYGTMQRLRLQAVILLLPLAGLALERVWTRIFGNSSGGRHGNQNSAPARFSFDQTVESPPNEDLVGPTVRGGWHSGSQASVSGTWARGHRWPTWNGPPSRVVL